MPYPSAEASKYDVRTANRALAQRRLHGLQEKTSRLAQYDGSSRITFRELADRWLANTRIKLKGRRY
ncbi:MAG TPA: hypothetical protein P5555_02925 [Candidatus Paceibacterota bacterium]|nr:hypothetical protein [Verrucomicrobiota bacterium]HRZ44126.1 hypothetical protein [Candidatus Paceibacterota bacterium]HRZ93988.1 hypothetical protein [Candidatus Paceibacterota bacterium]